MKLWDKGISTDAFIEKFTVGNDKKFDMYLAPYDVLGSIAHAFMLADVGIITQDEADAIVQELRRIYYRIEQGDFSIEDGIEDIHSQIELELTRALGDIGKKIHTGRSRNDQVLVDISLFLRSILFHIIDEVYELAKILIELSEQYKNHLLPGY
ncbi:MAG TPA: lyase family protein, partial [Candidatus Kapabacteria bacterium]|nr:lyase family protein [Candidatus Kapabacteria bacterium]